MEPSVLPRNEKEPGVEIEKEQKEENQLSVVCRKPMGKKKVLQRGESFQ